VENTAVEPAVKRPLLAEGIHQIVTAPLTVKGHLVGLLQMGTRQARLYTEEQLSLLASIGQQVGVAVENARLYEQAEQSAALVERTRLARELHDSVTQSLYSVTLYAEAATRILAAGDTKTAAEHLHDLGDTAREALREMRLLIFELRPPALEKSGLVAALQARLEAVEVRGGMRTDLQVEGSQIAERLPLLVQNELYQIAREALNNALKHARAQRVQVHLRFLDTRAILEVTDDGVGFDPESSREGGGLGMESMEERAARIGANLNIRSAPGQGAKVTVEVPLGGAS
jgi:signal transduction histidine kinase